MARELLQIHCHFTEEIHQEIKKEIEINRCKDNGISILLNYCWLICVYRKKGSMETSKKNM